MLTHPTAGGVNLDHWACCSLPDACTLKASFSHLQLICTWGISEGSYSDILLISCISSNLCSPASESIDSSATIDLLYNGFNMVILYCLSLIVEIL